MAKKKTSSTSPPAITQTDIKKFFELDKQRLKIQKDLDAKKRELDLLKEKFLEAVKKQRSKKIDIADKFRVSLVSIAGSVKWKDELIKQVGANKVAEIQEAAPKRSKLSVSKL